VRIRISITDREKMFLQQCCWLFLFLIYELVTGPDISEERTALICSYPQVEHGRTYFFSNVCKFGFIFTGPLWVPRRG